MRRLGDCGGVGPRVTPRVVIAAVAEVIDRIGRIEDGARHNGVDTGPQIRIECHPGPGRPTLNPLGRLDRELIQSVTASADAVDEDRMLAEAAARADRPARIVLLRIVPSSGSAPTILVGARRHRSEDSGATTARGCDANAGEGFMARWRVTKFSGVES